MKKLFLLSLLIFTFCLSLVSGSNWTMAIGDVGNDNIPTDKQIGEVFQPIGDVWIDGFNKTSGDGATHGFLQTTDGINLSTCTFSGTDYCKFTSWVLINNSVNYYMLTNGNGASVNHKRKNGLASHPYTTPFIRYTTSINNFITDSANFNVINAINVSNLDPYATLFIVSLLSPSNNSVTSESTVILNSSVSSKQGYLNANSTFYLWTVNNNLINKTVNSMTPANNYTSVTIYDLDLGNYKWNVEACFTNATGTECRFGEENFSLTRGVSIINRTYSNNAYETSSENFQMTVELSNNSEISVAYLVYNGTQYSVSDFSQSGNQVTLSKRIDLPLNPSNANTTKSFHWSFTFTQGEYSVTQTTTPQVQNVSFINLQICNPTYNVQAINFTLYDEKNQKNIIPNSNQTTTFESSWQYWVGSGQVYKNYSYQLLNSTTNNSYQFCIFPYKPDSFDFKTNVDIEYASLDYRENEYHLRNSTLTDISSDTLLYLLHINDATKFFLTFKQGTVPIDDAIIIVQKYFTGLGGYLTTGILRTDESGKATMWQDLDSEYKYSIIKDGGLLGTVVKTSICSIAPCGLTILISTQATNVTSGYYEFYAQNILSSLTYDRDTKVITYDFLDTTGLTNYFRLHVSQLNITGDNFIVCSKKAYTPAGTMTCNLTGYNGEFKAVTYVSRSPEKIDKTLSILDSDVIADLGLLGIFINLIVVIVAVFAGAVLTKGSPSGILTILGFVILGLKLIGIFPFTWPITVSVEFLILFLIWMVKT